MISIPLIVHLHGKRVGVLDDDGQRLIFRYEDASLEDAHGKNHSFLYAQVTRRMAPLYNQVCTLAWPELSTTLSMKIGSAATLVEVSPEHFKQLCGMAKLGWPMVRERIKTLCRQILDATGEPKVLPELKDAMVREIVTKRAERMLSLMEKTAD